MVTRESTGLLSMGSTAGRRERRSWALAGCAAWLLLCVALAPAQAAQMATTAGANSIAQAAMPSAARSSLPQLSDCVPCIGCHVAPAAAVQGVGGEPREPVEPAWPMREPAARAPTKVLVRGDLPSRLPMRIAYCRWLN